MIDQLLSEGHCVSCLVLPGQKYKPIPKVRYFEGDLRDPRSLEAFLQGTQTIIHLAGLTRAKTEREFNEINAEGTECLVRTARRVSPEFSHIIAMSSLAAVGPASDASGLSENAPLRPISSYGRSKAKLEECLQKFEKEVSWTIIRAPGVYGPYDRDFLQYFKLVDKGWRLVMGKRSVISVLFVKNLVSAIVACLDSPASHNQVFFISDDGCYDWDQIGGMMESSLGKKSFRVAIPFWLLRGIFALSEFARPILRTPPLITQDKLTELSQEYWVVCNKKANDLLGYRPPYSTEAAFKETVDWYRANGWI
jgi:nucleoside-diphosphate-sugar epimerase